MRNPMVRHARNGLAASSLLAVSMALLTSPASAQSAEDNTQVSNTQRESASARPAEIIVTARRRQEQAIDVPVAISAISSETIDRQGLQSLEGFAQIIPTLKINNNISNNGGIIAIRGVSSASSVPSVDQAVTVNVDGIPISNATVIKLGQFDLGQVEVLKGPQALFFGKNATGGIISLKSAEPTDTLYAQFRGEYEFEAKQWAVEGIASGPLTDSVGARLGVRYSDREGYFKNLVPANLPGAIPPDDEDAPGGSDLIVKGMLLFDNGGPARIKLTGGYADQDLDFSSALSQRVFCPTGSPQGPFADPNGECRLDGRTSTAKLPTGATAFDPRFPSDGVPYAETTLKYVVLDMAFDLNDSLTLNTVTGYNSLEFEAADHVSIGPIPAIFYADTLKKRGYSQEVRLASDNTGPLNWMAGFFYQDEKFTDNQVVVTPGPNVLGAIPFTFEGETISPFVQVNYDVFDALALSAGVRYTSETKDQTISNFSASLYPKKVKFTDWSPEVSLVYSVTDDANIYAAYKQGYKSGGFQSEFIAIPATLNTGTAIDNTFDKETVEGGEIGFKSRLFGGDLAFNATAFYYEYSNLQLARFNPQLVVSTLENVGASTTQGIEIDFAYNPSTLPGLTLNGALAYNEAEYDEFIAPCYNGQGAAGGCNLATNTQDLAGEDLPNAPRWSGNLSASYSGNFSDTLGFRVNAGASYSDSYNTVADILPNSRQDDYVLLDAGFALMDPEDRWEVAFIGRNLTDEYLFGSSFQVPATGGGGGAGTLSDIGTAGTSRGRELWIRATFRPFGK